MAFSFKKVFSSVKNAPTSQNIKVVGIDFGSSSVKVVEIEMTDGVIALSTYGELQLGPYLDSDMGSNVVLPVAKKIEALVDVMRESGVNAKEGIFSLSLSESFVTIMSLSAKKDDDIAPMVRVEARKYIPVPLTEVSLDWTEIPPDASKPALTKDIMLAAIQNSALAEIAAIQEAVQMMSKPLEIELFSNLRAITRESDSSIAVIDLGAQMCKLYIAEGGFLRRIHRVQSGGVYVTKTLAKELNISFEDAENLKRNYVADSEYGPRMKKAVENAFQPAFAEFKRAINQYELRSGTEVGRIVLTGGSVLFPELPAIARYALDKDVEISNPFNKIAYPAFLEDTLTAIAPLFSVALGAALRQFEA